MIQRHAGRILRHLRATRRQKYKTLNKITLSQSAVLHNLGLLQTQHPNSAILPVLKGNAYGHGLFAMAEILNAVHCPFLVVDGYFEADRIRYLTKHHILVLGYIHPDNVPLVDTKRCSFVVQDIAGLEAFGRLGRPVRIHAELNTGMNRLGLQPEELDAYLQTIHRFPKLVLEGVMTHLADADNETDDSFTRSQVEVFDRQVEYIRSQGFAPRCIHIAQTAGSTKVKSAYANAIRLGTGLYGINPLRPEDAQYHQLRDLRLALELRSTIIKVIQLRPGDKVGYNGTFTAERPTRIGVLPLGYYEGLSRTFSNNGLVVGPQNETYPVVGRVSMNHTMINITNSASRVGDEVVVYSRDPRSPASVQRLTNDDDTLSIVLFTGLSSSIRREIGI